MPPPPPLLFFSFLYGAPSLDHSASWKPQHMSAQKPRTAFSHAEALVVAHKLRLDVSVVSVDRLLAGMNVELEHGLRYGHLGLDVTGGTDSPTVCGQIAMAHFIENPGDADLPDYYEFLDHQEKRSEVHWNTTVKPSPVMPFNNVPGLADTHVETEDSAHIPF